MKLNDKLEINPSVYGVFSIQSYDRNGNLLEEYEDKNLIVYTARAIMASKIADLTGSEIQPINKFVLGTRGHHGENILDNVQVGEEQEGLGLFNPDRTELFSEESNEYNYTIEFNPNGPVITTNEGITGTLRQGRTFIGTDTATNSVTREVTGARMNEVKYTITVETTNANVPGRAIGYTEAALYAGDKLFAMKTFPARVKENTVKFVITWSVIF